MSHTAQARFRACVGSLVEVGCPESSNIDEIELEIDHGVDSALS